MKKIFMIAVMAVMTVAANAQDEKYYGSKEGGFAITFNANPVLNYIGNMFNGTQNNSVKPFEGLDSDNLFGGTTITGKYFLKDNIAIVGGFGFNNSYDVTNNYDKADDIEKVTSYKRVSTTAFQAMGGVEYRLRPGKRLQPIFGANLVYVHTNKWTYTTITDGENDGNYAYNGAPTNKLGLALTAGVEYFVIPQISLGANLDFGVAKTWRHSSYNVDPESTLIKSYGRIDEKDTFLSTGNFGANISLNFYF